MASQVFYWKGGDTYPAKSYGDGLATGATANKSYIWNEPNNWFVKVSNNKGEYYTKATRFPHGGDIVKFESLEDDSTNGLSGGPWPKTPLLFGGMGYLGNTLEWIGSNGTTAERQGKCTSVQVNSDYSCGDHGWVFGKTDYTGQFVGVTTSDNQLSDYPSTTEVQMRGVSLGADILVEFTDGYGADIASITADGIYSASHGHVEMHDIESNSLMVSASGPGSCAYVDDADRFYNCKVSENIILSNNLVEGDYYINNSSKLSRLDLRSWGYADERITVQVRLAETDEVITGPRTNSLFESERGKIIIDSSETTEGSGISIGYLEFRDFWGGVTTSVVLKNEGDVSAEYRTNNTLEFMCGVTVSDINMKAGKIEFSDLVNTESVHIKDGVIQGNAIVDLRVANFGIEQRLGTAGSGSDVEGINTKSSDVVYVFTPGTKVNSVSGTEPTEILTPVAVSSKPKNTVQGP